MKFSLSMFADDTAIVAHGVNLNDVITQITDDIGKLSKWFGYNKLAVNLDKTKCMYFGKSVYDEDESFYLSLGHLERVIQNHIFSMYSISKTGQDKHIVTNYSFYGF